MSERVLSPVIAKYLAESPPLPNFKGIPIDEIRAKFNNRQKGFNANLPSHDLAIENELAETAEGPIPIRIYRPNIQKLCPTIVFFHGGGFVLGNLDTLEGYCRELAQLAHCIVVSVDYPLAPENPFPKPVEASYAATCWIHDNLKKWKGDPDNLFVGGSSSGGTLAAAVSLMARDRMGPKLKGQILLCPMTDTDFNTKSYLENQQGFMLTRDACIWFLSQYIPNSKDCTNPLAVPLQTEDFSNLPPTLIVTAEFDPLLDEGREYAKRLIDADVLCDDLSYKGMIHGFPTLPMNFTEKENVFQKIHRFISNNQDQK